MQLPRKYILGLVLQAQSPKGLQPAWTFSRGVTALPLSPSILYSSARVTFAHVIFNVIQIKLEQVIKFSIGPWTKSNEFSKID